MNENLIEEFAVRRLYDKYTNAVNRRDWETYESCWTTDAVWELHPPIDQLQTGIENIMTECKRAVESQELFVQMNHAVVISDLTENTARGSVTLNEIGKARKDVPGALPGVEGMNILAFYADEIVKQNGEWKFKKRVYDVVHINFAAPEGDVFPLPNATATKT